MAQGAPKGNQFWKQRATHGRELLFSSPEILWEAAKEYFEATDKRKWAKVEFHGKDAERCIVDLETPYTKTGLYLFLDIAEQTWLNYRDRKDFLEVITRVDNIIYTQKFEGAAVGAFQANIIVRDLGLRDSKDLNINDKRKETAELFPEELDGEENKPES